MLHILSEHGADLLATDIDGDSSLHIASLNGHIDCMNFLISKGSSVNTINHHDATPITYALVRRHYDAVKLLIQSGASTRKTSRRKGSSPLLMACKICDYETLKMILSQGQVDLEEEDNGFTPLWVATTEGNIDCINALVEAGADVDARGNDNMTPLMYACSKGVIGAVRILVKKSDLSLIDSKGGTALHYACLSGSLQCLQELLNAGATVKCGAIRLGEVGFSPIQLAAAGGHRELLKTLYHCEADISPEDIQYARNSQVREFMRYYGTKKVTFLTKRSQC